MEFGFKKPIYHIKATCLMRVVVYFKTIRHGSKFDTGAKSTKLYSYFGFVPFFLNNETIWWLSHDNPLFRGWKNSQ